MAEGRHGRRRVREPQDNKQQANPSGTISAGRWNYPIGAPRIPEAGYDKRAIAKGRELIEHMLSLPAPVLTLADDVFVEQYIATMDLYYRALDHYCDDVDSTLELSRRIRLLMQVSRQVVRLLAECGRTPQSRLHNAPAFTSGDDEDIDEDEREFRKLAGISRKESSRQVRSLSKRRSSRNGSGRID